MFKRFSSDGRLVVVAATNAAALLGAESTEAEHFLIALLVGPPSSAQQYLRCHAVTREEIELAIDDTRTDVEFDDEDAAALSALGFDLRQILRQLDAHFGPAPERARIRRGPRKLTVGLGETAKHVLSQAMLEASFRRQEVTPEHLLLGLLRDPSPANAELIQAHSLSYDDANAYMFPSPQRSTG